MKFNIVLCRYWEVRKSNYQNLFNHNKFSFGVWATHWVIECGLFLRFLGEK